MTRLSDNLPVIMKVILVDPSKSIVEANVDDLRFHAICRQIQSE